VVFLPDQSGLGQNPITRFGEKNSLIGADAQCGLIFAKAELAIGIIIATAI
jgi:hypothetical protein